MRAEPWELARAEAGMSRSTTVTVRPGPSSPARERAVAEPESPAPMTRTSVCRPVRVSLTEGVLVY